MDYEIWEKYKDELHNESMKPLCRLSDEAREVMLDAAKDGAIIEVLYNNGVFGLTESEVFMSGCIYRISPDWPGPAKPELKTEYVDISISVLGGRHVVNQRLGNIDWLSETQNNVGFAGYVYEINGKERIRPRLLFDSLPDGTFRMRVPKAVRFVKGAV